jgi:4-amino-4-deoxy-L-arabinose transferase-like glycosyltransferase
MPVPLQKSLKPEPDGPNSRGVDSGAADSVGAGESAERRWIDWLLAVVVVVVNPLTINFGRYEAPLHQDSFAYACMARAMLEDFSLHLSPWGYVDSGVILPPLYSALIAIGSLWGRHMIDVAQDINSLSMITASVAIFFSIRARANRWVALAAVLVLNLSAVYLEFGEAALTEAPFIMVMALMLLVLSAHAEEGGASVGLGLALGGLCALVFWARHMGVMALPFCLLWVGIVSWRAVASRMEVGTRVGVVAVGFSLFVVPYAIVLFQQTGQHPLNQNYRLNQYTVTTDDPEEIAEIQALRAMDFENYEQIYNNRRQLMKLTKNGAGMYSNVVLPGDEPKGSVVSEILGAAVREPGAIISNGVKNIRMLLNSTGLFLPLFFVLTFTPLVVRRPGEPAWRRVLLAAFVWVYLAQVSITGGLIQRYVTVMAPFIIAYVAIELNWLARGLLSNQKLALGLAIVVLVGCGVTTTRFSTRPLPPRKTDRSWPEEFRGSVKPREPIFSLHPRAAFRLGGTFRVLPNAPVDLVAAHGRQTGVRWILALQAHAAAKRLSAYTEVDWYMDRELEKKYPELVELVAKIVNGEDRLALYRIRGADEGAGSAASPL